MGSRTTRAIVYASAFDGDGTGIDTQLALVGRVLPDGGRAVVVVDLGWADADAVCPPGLFAILRSARMRAVDVVAVDTVARFARDRGTALRVAAILSDAGVQIREAARVGTGGRPLEAAFGKAHARTPGTVRSQRRGAMVGPLAD